MTANTNIMDKNHISLVEWFEATPEYTKIHQLGLPANVIDTIEGDLALYVSMRNLDDFNDIPQGEIISDIVVNIDKQTRLRVLWECENAVLTGIHFQDPSVQFDAPSHAETIDRDQAVDDDGKAIYDLYTLSIDTSGPDDTEPSWLDFEFTVKDIEAFAETW